MFLLFIGVYEYCCAKLSDPQTFFKKSDAVANCNYNETMHWVHSSVVRAADCRSAGPWFKSGCALFAAADIYRNEIDDGHACVPLLQQELQQRAAKTSYPL